MNDNLQRITNIDIASYLTLKRYKLTDLEPSPHSRINGRYIFDFLFEITSDDLGKAIKEFEDDTQVPIKSFIKARLKVVDRMKQETQILNSNNQPYKND